MYMSSFICLCVIIVGSISMTKNILADFRQREDSGKNNRILSIVFNIVWCVAFTTLDDKLRWVVLLVFCIYGLLLHIGLFVWVKFGFIKDIDTGKIKKDTIIFVGVTAVVVLYYIFRHNR